MRILIVRFFFLFYWEGKEALWFLEGSDTTFCLILGQNLTWRVGNWLNLTLEHTAVSSGMIPTPGPCFLCATSCSFPSLPTFPRAAGLSFPIFPQSWSFSPFSNANLPEYSSAKTPPGCPGILAAPCFWGGSKSSGADKFLSLSCCHFLSLLPHCSALGHCWK